ncbi:MAG: hypothetical protein WC436_01955 [Candidatus Babeliales bacterium]
MLGKNLIKYIILISVLVSTPSCIKYYELSKEEFAQGKDLDDHKKVVANNIKRLSVYDQFETRAIFDTLWLSDSVRKAYVDINCYKQGKEEQAKQALMTRQLEENKHWITFYVLADVRDKTHSSLTDKNSYWSLFLQLYDGQKVMPISIKETEIEPEYQSLFNYRFNSFKRIYIVKFPATDLSGKNYLKNDKAEFKLVFSSPKKESFVTWSLLDKNSKEIKEKVLKDEDFYWI